MNVTIHHCYKSLKCFIIPQFNWYTNSVDGVNCIELIQQINIFLISTTWSSKALNSEVFSGYNQKESRVSIVKKYF